LSGLCSADLNGIYFFFSSRRRHTRCSRDWSSDVCSSDLAQLDVFAELLRRADQLLAEDAEYRRELADWTHDGGRADGVPASAGRSEERRVGKGGKSQWRRGA